MRDIEKPSTIPYGTRTIRKPGSIKGGTSDEIIVSIWQGKSLVNKSSLAFVFHVAWYVFGFGRGKAS